MAIFSVAGSQEPVTEQFLFVQVLMGIVPVPKNTLLWDIRELFYIPMAVPFLAKHSGLLFFTRYSSPKVLTNFPIIKLVRFFSCSS